MNRRPHIWNPKRRMAPPPADEDARAELARLSERVRYEGNPAHKKAGGKFALDPPAAPRPGKTLCDGCGVIDPVAARALLRSGLKQGLVSIQRRGRWPQNIWAVTEEGIPLEAELTNEEQGLYHGYPLASTDAFGERVLERWGPHAG